MKRYVSVFIITLMLFMGLTSPVLALDKGVSWDSVMYMGDLQLLEFDGTYYVYDYRDDISNNAANTDFWITWLTEPYHVEVRYLQQGVWKSTHYGQYVIDNDLGVSKLFMDGTGLTDSAGIYYPDIYLMFGKTYTIQTYDSLYPPSYGLIYSTEPISNVGVYDLDGMWWLRDSMSDEMFLQPLVNMSFEPKGYWTKIVDGYLTTSNVGFFEVYQSDAEGNWRYLYAETIDSGEDVVTRIPSFVFNDLKAGNNLFKIIGYPSIEGESEGTLFFEINYYGQGTSDETLDESGFGDLTRPVAPEESWDLLGWVKYFAQWLLYIVASIGYVFVSAGAGLGSLVSSSASFIDMLAEYFSFLPTEWVVVITLGMTLGVLLKIFKR